MTERFGPFELVELLGRGGMAEVHRAVYRGESGFAKPMAVKRMLPHKLEEPDARTGFEDEARLCSRLRHPHIVEVYDFGRIGEVPYLSMELVDGWSLQRVLAHGQSHGRGLGVEAAVEIGAQVCSGLSYAHAARDETGQALGVVHRDLKPGNLMLTGDGVVKVADFGVAKAATNVFATKSDATRGTPCYMSPEMCEGRPVDLRSDLFSLATILAEVVLGYPIFLAETEYRSMYRIAQGDVGQAVAALDEVDPRLAAALAVAFQVEADRRFPDAAAMREALVDVTGGRPGPEVLLTGVQGMLELPMEDGPPPPAGRGESLGPGDADDLPSPTENSDPFREQVDRERGSGSALRPTLLWTTAAVVLVAALFGGAALWRSLGSGVDRRIEPPDERTTPAGRDTTPSPVAPIIDPGTGEAAGTAAAVPAPTAAEPATPAPTGSVVEPSTPFPDASGGEEPTPARADPAAGDSAPADDVEAGGAGGEGDSTAVGAAPALVLREPDPAAVQAAVASDAALQRCFREHGTGGEEPAALRVRFTMGADGALTSVDLGAPTGGDGALGSCVTDRLRSMRFDATGFDWTSQLTLRPGPDLEIPGEPTDSE